MLAIKKYWQKVALLSFGHGLNDFAAGYMLGNLFYLQSQLITVGGFLIYNLLAFGGQYFAAVLLERFQNHKLAIILAALANALAVISFSVNPFLSLVLAGGASAFYHVAGGVVCSQNNKATGIGFFAAPGIMGLVLAGYLAFAKVDVWLALTATCGAFILLLQLADIDKAKISDTNNEKAPSVTIDDHDLLMILLLAIISLRSAVWNIFQIVHEQNYTWLLAIGASAFVGKLIGGWISDRIGLRFYSLISLITAMPLVTFFKEEIILFCIGISLLQSAIPANTALLIHYSRSKEKAFAFSFGVAIVFGFFIMAPLKFFAMNTIVYWLLVVSLLITGAIYKHRKRSVVIS